MLICRNKVDGKMSDFPQQLEQYLRETLDVTLIPARPRPWKGASRLPLFLQQRYLFLKARFLELDCLFAVDEGEEGEPPAVVRKHLEQIQLKWDGAVVYVRSRVSSYNRKRLIGQKVPFVVPGNQLYLPMLGVDLREHFRSVRQSRSVLTPSAQAVFIHALYNPALVLNPTQLAAQLGYSVMSMSRAMRELEAARLGQSNDQGKERCFSLTAQGPEAWGDAQPFLRSPVRSRHTIAGPIRLPPPGRRAGLSALAQYSMLAEPRSEVTAMTAADWTTLKQDKTIIPLTDDEPGAGVIEVWRYRPTLFSGSDVVDRLSLYLSLRDNPDERVEAALEEMMGDMAW